MSSIHEEYKEYLKKDYIKFNKKLLSYIELNNEIISREGIAEVIAANLTKRRATEEDYQKDYLMFCLTKFTKTLKAILKLVENNLDEDALILTRSNYEIVLHAKALINNSDMINHFIQYKLGLEGEKDFSYKRGANGGINRRKIIDNSNPYNEINYVNTIIAIAKEAQEELSYEYIYKFLSELAHCNFLTSGYYREGVYYTTEQGLDGAKLNALIFNIGLCLKLYEACVESELLGEDYEEIEDILCSVIMKDKVILQEWFEKEEKRVLDISLTEKVCNPELNEYIDLLIKIKNSLLG